MRSVLALLGRDEYMDWANFGGQFGVQLVGEMIGFDPSKIVPSISTREVPAQRSHPIIPPAVLRALRHLDGLTLASFSSPFQSGSATVVVQFWKWTVCCLNIVNVLLTT